ncbi:hypothetical protein Lesp02_00360 [Lentzea sp. NBRC 105346]|uniref:hypothetical protein n=1 Tax=Lentzea sp. NBRC 105346 TaxID=3032205 RepID=UPI0024A3F4B7|nr:hypothetical protein [Lentzea sp. NBRC 105346]GLZ27846.1 hypothetical protein Lesp02_00360 [Lentzea sp. NBRC 105346]
MIRLLIAVPVAAVLLGGCGGSPSTVESAATPSSSDGTIVVAQEGSAPARTQWYVRIETTKAESVTEAAYPNAPIALTKQLPAGQYRVISWHRTCSGACPASGEDGLGPLEEVCGAATTVTPGGRVAATVVIDAEGGCSVRVGT